MVLEIKTNFGGNHSDYWCPLCHKETDTQEHPLDCPELDEINDIAISFPKYEELFEDQVKKKMNVPRIIKKIYKKRKQIIKKKAKIHSEKLWKINLRVFRNSKCFLTFKSKSPHSNRILLWFNQEYRFGS